MSTKAFVATAVLLLPPQMTFAQVMTGNDILTICTSQEDPAQAGFCVGYVIGLNEGLMAGVSLPFIATGAVGSAEEANLMVSQTLGVCLPPEVEGGQLLGVLVLDLQAHPESRHNPARGLYHLALQDAFPCPSL